MNEFASLVLSCLAKLGELRWKRCGRKPIRHAVTIELPVRFGMLTCDCWMFGPHQSNGLFRVYKDGTVRHCRCGQVMAQVSFPSNRQAG